MIGRGGDGRPLPKDGNGKPDADAMRALFLQHRKLWVAHAAKQAVLDAQKRDIKAAIKVDGFTLAEFVIADDLAGSLKQSQKRESEVARILRVAAYMGHPMGAQLDLFSQPDRTPSVDVAYDIGKMASMEGKSAKPDYAPETEQYRAYLSGYHDHQTKIMGGFKRTEEAEPEQEAEGGGVGVGDDNPEDDEPAGWGESKLPPAARDPGGL